MSKPTPWILLAILLAWSATAAAHPHILRLADRTEISFAEMINDLKDARVVFVGELHDHDGHHRAQLALLDALRKAGRDFSIGLEMFRKDDQQALDLWLDNRISEDNFVEIYNQNWSMWPKYREIFVYARDFRIPLVGLNISREITRQVAAEGFASISEQQSKSLDKVACTIDPTYMNYIRRAMGGHGGHGDSFVYFCEAQLLWDISMAQNLSQHLETRPNARAIVLAGSGHSWKYGMPSRMDSGASPDRVILPEIPGRIDRFSATEEDADYLWLDVGMEGWTAP
ncbi:ChaN family lipoprotein [Trichloromonas sp.]|uniref:ChaN family lipoprotein n=1 Tax=Trichloromonas sp. TaxID=3069249 RepID=UPI003D817AD9